LPFCFFTQEFHAGVAGVAGVSCRSFSCNAGVLQEFCRSFYANFFAFFLLKNGVLARIYATENSELFSMQEQQEFFTKSFL